MRKVRLITIRRVLLWLAVGPRTYAYMARSLKHDPRLRTCRLADIVVRKDAFERRIEADWLRTLATIVMGRWKPNKRPPIVTPPSEVCRADPDGGPYAEAIPLAFNERQHDA